MDELESDNNILDKDLVITKLEKQDFSSKIEQLRFEKMDFSRSKTSLRMKYEAEVNIIQQKLGSLEEIRASLGLSRRKMCQLLMVDPSAWTRWTSGKTTVPPHIFRALQWYLAINEKYPGLGTAYWLSSLSNKEKHSLSEKQKESLKQELFKEILEEIELEQKNNLKAKPNSVEKQQQIIIRADENQQETNEMLQFLREDILSTKEQLTLLQDENSKLKANLKYAEKKQLGQNYLLISLVVAFLISLILIVILV